MRGLDSLIKSGLAAIDTLTASKAAGLFTPQECQDEEQRITLLLERQLAMLDRLSAMHARATSVSAAALLHAMTRGDLASVQGRPERDASPRRSLASASDLVVD